jgi:pimeloyl-ACP methyl ester carboxylesterase
MSNFKTNLAHVNFLLFTGQNDALVAPDDYKKLQEALPSSAKTILVNDYNHLDYMWAGDVNDKVNSIVKDFLKNMQII